VWTAKSEVEIIEIERSYYFGIKGNEKKNKYRDCSYK
jgi:hypothetical protein